MIDFTLSSPALAVVLCCDGKTLVIQGPFSAGSIQAVIHMREAGRCLASPPKECFNLLRLDADAYLVHTVRMDARTAALIVYPFSTPLAEARAQSLVLTRSLRSGPLAEALLSLEGLRLRTHTAAWQTKPEQPVANGVEVF